MNQPVNEKKLWSLQGRINVRAYVLYSTSAFSFQLSHNVRTDG